MDMTQTWIKLRDVYPMFNYSSYESAKGAVSAKRFPVVVRRMGRDLVCDKEAVRQYFLQFRQESLTALQDLFDDIEMERSDESGDEDGEQHNPDGPA